jgi:hypothetical protein
VGSIITHGNQVRFPQIHGGTRSPQGSRVNRWDCGKRLGSLLISSFISPRAGLNWLLTLLPPGWKIRLFADRDRGSGWGAMDDLSPMLCSKSGASRRRSSLPKMENPAGSPKPRGAVGIHQFELRGLNCANTQSICSWCLHGATWTQPYSSPSRCCLWLVNCQLETQQSLSVFS